MNEWRVTNIDELQAVVEVVLDHAVAVLKREDGSAVLALQGDLGAGKTTFMQQLAAKLGIEEHVTSPTFVVMKKYDTTHDIIKQLTHIDAYRIEEVDEMRPLRFSEELKEKDTMIGIEWAEHITELLPPHTLHLDFKIDGDQRIITLKTNG